LGWSKYVYYGTAYSAKLNPDPKILVEADSAFSKVIRERPNLTTSYAFRARIAKYQDDNVNPKWLATTPYESLVQLLTVINPELLAAPTAKKELVEAYTYLGTFYSITDKEKAIATYNKALVIDPQNVAIAERLKPLIAVPAAPAVKKPAAIKKK
jgi:tetratricopeptide (TPR) repeat protein